MDDGIWDDEDMADELIEGGRPEPVASAVRVGRRPVVALALGLGGGILIGWALASHPWTPLASPSGTIPSAAAGSSVESGAVDGVTVPQLVNAVTVPALGQHTVSTQPDPATHLSYDYSLVAAEWLAPDGTVRAGPPGCTEPSTSPQHLVLAVVHARAFAGGPDRDVVVWYRCAGAGSVVGSQG